MIRYAVALGSNLGPRAEHLRSAIHEIARFGSDVEVSGLYETASVGGSPDQNRYLNAVVVFSTDLDGSQLLKKLQRIEGAHDRVREERWGPRTLDLDIISSGDRFIHDPPRLVVPHPRAHERRFVLEPLVDVWPDALVAAELTAAAALGHVSTQDVELVASDWLHDDQPEPITET